MGLALPYLPFAHPAAVRRHILSLHPLLWTSLDRGGRSPPECPSPLPPMLSFGRVGNAAYRDVPGVYVRGGSDLTIFSCI